MNPAVPHSSLSSAIDLSAYARRLGLPAIVLQQAPSLSLLQLLHRRQPEAIPFENLTPLLGQPVPLAAAELGAKLLARPRGGYCFELNHLFLQVLQQLGFQARGLAARVRWNVPAGGMLPRTHMLILIELDGESWLADVGFGGLSLTAPLRLVLDEEQSTPHNRCRLLAVEEGYLLQVWLEDGWQPLYAFDLQVQQGIDFEMMNWFVATHPGSRFTTQLVAARVEGECRHALGNTRYSCHRPEGSDKRQLRDVDEVLTVLHEIFGIAVGELPGLRQRLEAVLDFG